MQNLFKNKTYSVLGLIGLGVVVFLASNISWEFLRSMPLDGSKVAVKSSPIAAPMLGKPVITVTANGSPVVNNGRVNGGATPTSAGSMILAWNTVGATSCTIDGGWAGISGSQTFVALQSMTHVFVCTNSAGSTTFTFSVFNPVFRNPEFPKTVITITANGVPVVNNGRIDAPTGSVDLVWKTTNAASCTFDGVSTPVSGSQTFTNVQSMTHTFICTNSTGSTTFSFSVFNTAVVKPPVVSKPIITITANGSPVVNNGRIDAPNGTVALVWNASGATSCTFNGASTPMSGSETFKELPSATHNFTCTNTAGSTVFIFSVFSYTVVTPVVTPVGTLAATSGDTLINRSLLLAGTPSQKITSFQVTASKDNIKLKTIAITGTRLSSLSNIRITNSTGVVLGMTSNLTETNGIFSNLDSVAESALAMDKSAIYYIIADVNSSTDTRGVAINVVASGSQIIGSKGTIAPISGSMVQGAAHDISQNTFKIIQTTPMSKNLATDALEFIINAFGRDSITLSGATFKNVLSGYTGSMVITVVRKSDNALLGSTSGSSGVVKFTANNTIVAGSSATYIVKIVGAVMASGPITPDWLVSLTDLTTNNGLSAANYPKNTYTLPLISNK